MITSYVTEFRLLHMNVLPAESRVHFMTDIHMSVRVKELPFSESEDFKP